MHSIFNIINIKINIKEREGFNTFNCVTWPLVVEIGAVVVEGVEEGVELVVGVETILLDAGD